MLIYNTLCPTVNHSFQYEIWKSRYPQVHNPKISPSLYDYDEMIPTKVKTQVPFEELSERRTKGYIYYTLNVDDAFDFLDSFSSQSLLNFQSEQDDYIEKQMEDLLSFKLISPAAAKITREQYSKILFIEGLGFDRSYVGDIINAKLKSHSEDVITNFIPQEPTKPNQQIGINREELMRIANFKPEVVIDNKLYPLKWQDEYIRDKSRYIYIL